MEHRERRRLELMHELTLELEHAQCSMLRPVLPSPMEDQVSDSSSRMAAAETASAIAATVGLIAAGTSRWFGWLVQRTKHTDALAQHRSEIMARFDRFERWCARVDAFMMRYNEHRIADERFMALTETALTSVAQRIGRMERMQDAA